MARAAARTATREAKWRAVVTSEAEPNVRVRARTLPQEADAGTVLLHNTWDNVQWGQSEVDRAEATIAAQVHSPAVPPGSAAQFWDAHYSGNLRNYHDRHYLHNDFPQLIATEDLEILETGCGVGNSLLPLLAANAHARIVGCDISPRAVTLVTERLERECLAERGRAVVWDLGQPLPASLPPLPFAHVALAVFTLSALPPADLPRALDHLHRCLLPGGRLLFRDYGRLDLKQLKFARAAGSRLRCEAGWEWYARGDGTTVVFFSPERITALAHAAGFVVEEARVDQRLVVNRADRTKMQRVWLVAVLRKPTGTKNDECNQVSSTMSLASRWRRRLAALRPPLQCISAIGVGLAACALIAARIGVPGLRAGGSLKSAVKQAGGGFGRFAGSCLWRPIASVLSLTFQSES